MNEAQQIVRQFDFPSEVAKVEAYGSGIINDTYIVTFKDPPEETHVRLGQRAILQRINSQVFPDPPSIMHNLAIVLEHAASKIQTSAAEFLLPPIYRTKQTENCFRDDSGQYWRAIGFIEGTVTSDILSDRNQAHEAGVALGRFHQMFNDLPVTQLRDTLPGFHDTPAYLSDLDAVLVKSDQEKLIDNNGDWCLQQIEQRRSLARLLIDSQPGISQNVMHGDPKLNNILFDEHTGKAVSIIDLDTVKPGFIHYDIGDCIRSCCNSAGEMPDSIDDVQFMLGEFESILEGYLSQAMEVMTGHDLDILYDVVRLLPFELGIRFFTDYLNGNRYFKVNTPEDNLYRARVQFRLLASIESQEQAIRQVIERCGLNVG